MPDIGVLEPGAGAGAAAPLSGTSPFDRRVVVVGGAVFAVLMAFPGGMGFTATSSTSWSALSTCRPVTWISQC